MNTPEAMVATAKAVDDTTLKSLAASIQPGVILVDFTARISGTLKKGNPYEQTIPAAANPWKLLAKALSKLNATTIESLVQESLAVDDEEETAVKAAASDAIARITAATKRQISGRITANLIWEMLA